MTETQNIGLFNFNIPRRMVMTLTGIISNTHYVARSQLGFKIAEISSSLRVLRQHIIGPPPAPSHPHPHLEHCYQHQDLRDCEQCSFLLLVFPTDSYPGSYVNLWRELCKFTPSWVSGNGYRLKWVKLDIDWGLASPPPPYWMEP